MMFKRTLSVLLLFMAATAWGHLLNDCKAFSGTWRFQLRDDPCVFHMVAINTQTAGLITTRILLARTEKQYPGAVCILEMDRDVALSGTCRLGKVQLKNDLGQLVVSGKVTGDHMQANWGSQSTRWARDPTT